jgi:uncharacterized protein YjbJ (UPF0337 family)
MESVDPGKEVRKGTWQRLIGKFKKGVGAAVGNEGLTASGELHELAADKHMEAAGMKADADQHRTDTIQQYAEAEQDLDEARAEVKQEEAVHEGAVEQAKAKRKATANIRGQQRTRAVVKHASNEKQAASRKVSEAQQTRKKAQEKADARRGAARGAREAAAALDETEREIERGN